MSDDGIDEGDYVILGGGRIYMPVRQYERIQKHLREFNRRRWRLDDLLTALERVRSFVDEHGESDREVMLDSLHRYVRVAVLDLEHVCAEADRINNEAGLVEHQWRHLA